jgi:hypothetical protein
MRKTIDANLWLYEFMLWRIKTPGTLLCVLLETISRTRSEQQQQKFSTICHECGLA